MNNTKASKPERDARLQDMKTMRAAGKTLAEIGVYFGISRERVRQLIGNTGNLCSCGSGQPAYINGAECGACSPDTGRP